MRPGNALEVDGKRLWESLQRCAEAGRFRGTGVRRLALSSEDKEVRDLYVGWVREAGCTAPHTLGQNDEHPHRAPVP